MANSTPADLCKGLLATCQDGDHWCCNEDFLKLCGLSAEQMEQQIKKWWGNKDLWLDMIATEVAKLLGAQLDIESSLGNGWRLAVDAWVDAAYMRATAEMRTPPARPLVGTKAAVLAHLILKSGDVNIVASSQRDAASEKRSVIRQEMRQKRDIEQRRGVCVGTAQSQCGQCGKPFSQRLGKCPSCFPASPKRGNADKRANNEAKLAQWRTLPSAPMQADIPWSDASEMMWCHGGSGGVFLLNLPTGAICLKAERCTPEMLFAQRLAGALTVRMASMRVVPKTHQEYAAINSALHRAVPTLEDHKLQLGHVRAAESLTVMEYVQGCAMMGMPAHLYLQEHRDTVSFWHGLGRLMGFDLLINNFDRLPLAWSNEGNLGNVMLSPVSAVVGIDQSAQPITHAEGLRNYVARLQKVCLEAVHGPETSFKSVKEAIYNNTAIELSSEEINHLRHGCLVLLKEVSCLTSSGDMDRILNDITTGVTSELELRVESGSPLKSCCNLVREATVAVHDVLAEHCRS